MGVVSPPADQTVELPGQTVHAGRESTCLLQQT